MPNFYRLAAAPLALAYALAGRATDALAVLGQMSGKTPYLNVSLACGAEAALTQVEGAQW